VATDRLKKELEALPGVGSVTVAGGLTREIQVKVDQAKLEARGIGLNTLQISWRKVVVSVSQTPPSAQRRKRL